MDLKKCKICNQLSFREPKKKYKSGSKQYVDDLGRLWNGKVCPECNRKRVKEKMKEIRNKIT